jgi:hypothetical protein
MTKTKCKSMGHVVLVVVSFVVVLLLMAGCALGSSQSANVGGILINQVLNKSTLTSTQRGTDINGYYYSFWKQDNTGSVSMTINNSTKGNYTTSWTNCSDFMAGLGWYVGSPTRVINYSGSFDCGRTGSLELFGWATTDKPIPLDYSIVEYHIVENYGDWTPPGGTSLGTFDSDEGSYKIYKIARKNAPWIVNGNPGTFYQYWSVRTTKRSSGTITFSNHINAWKNAGMTLSAVSAYYQIMQTEGYQSTGSSDITVSSGVETNSASLPSEVATIPLYRYWNGIEHFYTTNGLEIGTATAGTSGNHGFTCEGIQCYVNQSQASGTIPLYRYWNGTEHFYTTYANEIGTTTTGTLGNYGYTCEGIQCYVYPEQVSGTVPLYRYWNGTEHFYTTSGLVEIGTVTTGATGNGYTCEGIQCYVLPAN